MAGQQIDIVANLLMKVDGAEAGINKLKSSLSKLKMPEGLENSFKKSFANLDTLFARYKSQVEKGFDTKADVNAFSKTSKALDAELTRISKHFTELTGKEINFKVKSDDIIHAEKELEKLFNIKNQLSKESLKFEVSGGKNGIKDIETLLQKLQSVAGKTKTGDYAANALNFLKTGDVQNAIVQLDKASVSFKRLKQEKQDAFKATGFDMGGAIAAIITTLSSAEGKFGDVNAKIAETKNNLANFQADQIQKAGDYVEDLANKFAKDETAIRQADGAMQDFARSSQSMSQQLGDLQQSTQYFFSLRNMINLFKRGVDDAIQSVKELDKAMTDTAVVTDYNVSDMWNMLPQYTKIANDLGATTQGAYETMTLYFQQGLDQQQAFEVGAETMKMARIAGLDYAETTDMMTAALRGFNMELNETSAKRVNDVYSELAAITASDTEELGTAMQRTASIAHSAGASFEGTTAFLAQAIETTREPAENIGTAMKTIIARFQEMKKNPLEIGEVEGEEVNFNKIDAALKTIGVDLVDTNGQFRDFDKVMLDISAKWDTLSQSQQRYIATVAAGSRQQSRFIAMVSDYDRTMQLMEAANNSTGASDEQFGKTMDSLEAKLNKLHNAWQAFTMGIANNGMIKLAVDGVTSLLSGVNSLIDTLSGGIGPIKSFLSIFTAFTGLKVAGKVANGLIGTLGGLVDPKTSLFKGMVTGASGLRQGANAAQAKAISDPIVAVLKQIYGKLNGNQTSEQNLHRGSWQDFKNAQERFRNNANKGTIEDTIGSLRGLDKAQINGILANNPAIENRLQKGLNQSIGKMNITEGTQKLVQKTIPGIFTAFKRSPNMSPDAFVKALRPNQIGYALVKSGEKEAGQEIINAYNQQTRKNVEAFMSEHGVKSWEEHKQRMNGRGGEGYRDALKDYLNKTNNINNLPLPEPTKWDKLGASVGAVGSMFGMAGQAATSFGVALSNLGLEKTGNAIASLGTSLSSVGSTIGSMAMTIAAVGNAGGLGALLAPIVPYLPYIAAAAAIIGTIGAVAIKSAKETQAIKDSAEQVTKSFEETSKQTKENIATLQQYKSEMAHLSQGVDQNGNNVSLSTDDYDEYLRIVDEVAAMNPDIVRGYNAQGHAIIDNNTALQKTLDLQEQINKETTNQYLKQTSLEKLLAARNLRSSDYTKNASFVGANASRVTDAQAQFMYGDKNYGLHKFNVEKQVIPLQKQAQKVAKELQQSNLFKQDEKSVKSLLQSYGIDFDKLLEGEKESVDNFVKNQSNIQSQLSSAAEGLGIDFSDKFNDAFEDLSIDTDAFNASIDPIFKNLAARVSNNEAFKNITPEIQTSIMSGLKEIAKQDISASEMISQSNDLISIFQKLGDKTGEYGEVIKLVESEQEKFSDSLDEEAYSKGIQPAIDKLYELRDAAAELHTTAGDAVVEFYDNQIAQIENFTQTGTARLGDALNTMSGQFAEAKGAYDEFSEAVKDNDFYTAADNMKKIFDEIDNEVDRAGLGSKKFWMGAEELLGAENIDGLGAEAVAKQLDTIKPLLQEGEDGFQAFWSLIDQHKKELNELEGVTVSDAGWLTEWPDDLSEISKELGISEKLLASLLDKSRQFAHIDLSDPTKVREALATSDTTLTGLNGDKKNLYVKEDSLRASLREADYTTTAEQDHEIQRMQDEEQIFTIGNPEELSDKQVSAMRKDLNLGDLPALIETFGKTGEYNKEEIQGLAERFGVFEDQDAFDAAYDDWIEKSTDPTQYKQTDLLSQLNSNVSSIAAAVVSKRIQEGHLDKSTAEQSEYATYGQKGVADTLGQLFSKGKDGNGNYFQSDAAFERNKTAVEEQRNSYQEYLDVLREGQKNATGAEKEKFDAEIKSYEKMIGYLNQWLEEGEVAYNKYKQENQSEDSSDSTESEKPEVDKDKDDKAETVYDEEALKKQKEYWEKIDETVFGWLDKLFNPGGEEQRQQYTTGGYESNTDFSIGEPTEDPKEIARQTAQEKFNAWIQGLKEGTNAPIEDPKVAAGEKAKHQWSELWGSIKNAFINGGKDADPKVEAGEKARQTWTDIWNSVKQAFNNGGKNADPKVEAGEKAREIWKGLWDKVKKAISSNPDVNPNTKANGTNSNSVEVESTGTTKVKFTGEIANPEELKASLEQQITTLLNSIASQQSKMKATATVNVKQGTIEKPKAQKAVVNYTKGKQAKAEAQTANVNYELGKQEAPKTKTATVNYTLGTVPSVPTQYATLKLTLSEDSKKFNVVRAATGMNNTIPYNSAPSFGSAARGKYGTVGPKNKGGLTLTGEEGFEIAWIPSENRSMVLGANGPQMLNLPPDAVVYTHEQSKKIIRQKAIPAGSHRGESSDPVVKKQSNPGGGGGGKEKEKKKGSSSKKTSQAATAVIKITQKAGKVLVWWENAGHRMEKAQRDAKGVQRKLENLLKTFGTTAEEYKKAGEDYRKYLEQQKDIAAEREKRATDEFRMTDEGRSAVDETKVNNAREKMNAAEEKYQKNKTKANKEAWKKAQKSYRKAANSELAARGARREISYEYTKTTTKKGSKKKTQKVTKKTSVNLANYITTDPITGAYVIDQDKIDKIANGYKNSKGKWVKGNKSKAEAIAKAAEDQLNDLESKLKSAEDDRIKAEEELAEFYNTVYETFYAWEKTITDAYVLGQQIEKLGNLRTIFDAVEDLEFAKIEAGFGSVVDSLPKVTDALKQNQELMLEQVQANRQLIDATFKEYQSALSVEDTAAAAANSEQSEKAKKDAEARAKALEFLENIGQIEDFNYSEATNALNAPEWTQEDYDKIKDGLDQIAEKQTAYYDAISKTYESMTEVYQTIEEYQSYMSDFENDLISGMEEQANKEIDKLNKINSSIDTATKDLIDEVKRKLDERRKQEDNAKTERDIAQKQQRFAALRADTSGGHQVEIAQLEKEIAEAQQGYQRTLEDQLLDKLSNQADEASKQREHQIQLLEAQRDFAAATGLNVEQINTWLKDPTNNKAQIRAAWLANNGYEDAGALERTQLEEQFESAWLRFLAYREALPELVEKTETDLDANGEPKQILTPVESIQKSTEDILKNLQKGLIIRELTIADAKTDNYGNQRSVSQIKAMMGTNGQSVKAQNFLDEGFNLSQAAESFSKEELASEGITAQTFADKSVDYGTARTIYSAEELSEIDAYKDEANKERYDDFLYQRGNKTKTSSEYWGKIEKQGLEKLIQLGEALGKSKAEILWDLVNTDALTWQEVIAAAKKAGYSAKTLKSIRDSSNWSKGAKNNFGKAVNKVYGLKGKKAFKTTFATGGIANFTGPAWLDGTPSKPELVLNATDTKNFLALRDVLDRAMASTGSVTNSYGGNATYEININVDKIEKDYDVDRVAERVKKIIVKDSGYRNVTQVRNFR